jgi:pimeloyl-ACP methyl ester carboxylesterase
MERSGTSALGTDSAGPRSCFVGGRHGRHTVVFVHGLRGHFRRTWGRFPELVHDDPDLPRLDVLCWGYRSNGLPWDLPIEVEANRLVSELTLLVEGDRSIHLVGHSLGGLVILQGLCEAHIGGRAQEPPCGQVRWITLYASPVMGSMAAAIAKRISAWIFYPLVWLLSQQVRGVSRGEFVDRLIRDVVNRIYRPQIKSGDSNSKRQIPIRACAGTRDRVVGYSSVAAFFDMPPALRLDANHRSIKLPASHFDKRYRALRVDLERGLADDFGRLCARCLAPDQETRALAQDRFDDEYGYCLDTRIAALKPEVRRWPEHRGWLTALVWKLGASRCDIPPARVFNDAFMVLQGAFRRM